jgi:ABC-type amino acid transport substrate-binding protein
MGGLRALNVVGSIAGRRRAVMLALTGVVGAACAGTHLDRMRTSGKIHLGVRESSVPFSYLDSERKPIGYAVDLCLRLVEAIRRKAQLKSLTPEFVVVTSSTRIPMLVEGKIDLECGSTTNNAERRAKVAFTIPHYITGARYLVRADSPIEGLTQFEGKRLVSTQGSTPLKAIEQANKERLLRITILAALDHAKAVDMVAKGEADGFAMDDVLLFGLRSSYREPDRLKVVGKFLTIEPLAIMLPKDDLELKAIVDAEMKRLISSREAYAIYERWFLQAIPPKDTALNLPMNYLLTDYWKYPTDWVPN